MKKLFLIVVTVFSLDSYAGNQTGVVDYVLVRASDGLISFRLKGGTMNAAPTCATQGYWMIKDENSNAGKLQYSMILSAQASGKTVYISGTNTCARWSDGEDADLIKISNQ
jgi:hypothetical protein